MQDQQNKRHEGLKTIQLLSTFAKEHVLDEKKLLDEYGDISEEECSTKNVGYSILQKLPEVTLTPSMDDKEAWKELQSNLELAYDREGDFNKQNFIALMLNMAIVHNAGRNIDLAKYDKIRAVLLGYDPTQLESFSDAA